jgi:DNA-binding response OmpR family regulator
MLFEKRGRTTNRILIVEDEPLVAFSNEHVLLDHDYEIVATVDNVQEAMVIIENQSLDLVVTDVRLSNGGSGIDVARAAHLKAVPVLFAAGNCPLEAHKLAIACLAKPYSDRDLVDAIDAIDARRSGRQPRRMPAGLTYYAL